MNGNYGLKMDEIVINLYVVIGNMYVGYNGNVMPYVCMQWWIVMYFVSMVVQWGYPKDVLYWNISADRVCIHVHIQACFCRCKGGIN